MKMKTIILIIMSILVLIFAVGCEEPCNTPDPIIVKDTITVIDTVYIDTTIVPEFIIPTLNLQPVEANLAKSLIDQYPDGIPLYEINALVLSKSSGGTIEFEDVNATKEYFYILVNNGSADIRKVVFNTELVVASPGYISVVESNSAGIGLISILKIAIPHLIPLDGAGALLPFEIGTFIDTINTTYEYTSLQGDTVQSFQNWEVTGNRLGASFDIMIDSVGIFADSSTYNLKSCGINPSYPDLDFDVAVGNVPNVPESTLGIVNTGNVPLAVTFYKYTIPELNQWNPVDTTYTIPVSGILSLENHVELQDNVRVTSKFFKVYTLTSAINFYGETQLDGDLYMTIMYEETP